MWLAGCAPTVLDMWLAVAAGGFHRAMDAHDRLNSMPDEPTGLTSSRLLHGLQAGSAEAWQKLVALCTPLVYGWCRAAGLQEADAADVVQDTLRSVFTGVGGLRLDRPDATFRGWLWTIAHHKLQDLRARRATEPDGAGGTQAQAQWASMPGAEGDPGTDTTASRLSPDDRTLLLRQALELVRRDFQADTWQAFWAVAVEGRSSADVARSVGMSRGAVRQARYRVLQRLREEFGALLE